MRDSYTLITLDTVDKDEAAILAVLTRISQRRLPNDLRLLNYYELLPISYDASIKSIDNNLAELTVHKNQAFIMAKEQMTIIRSAHFRHDAIASVFAVKIERELAFLTNFSYVKLHADHRRHVRVNMGGRLVATFQSGALTINGTVFDLSVGGMAIISNHYYPVSSKVPGVISFKIKDKEIRCLGTLVRDMAAGVKRKYLFELKLNGENEKIIYQLIFQRECELLHELSGQLE
jgi:hypothetical protein